MGIYRIVCLILFRLLFVSYYNINNAKKAFSKLLELHLNSKTFTITYIFDNIGEKTPLSSINESSDSYKSDKSDEGSDTEKKDKDKHKDKDKDKEKVVNTKKEEDKKPEKSNERVLNEGWNPLHDLIGSINAPNSPESQNLNLTMPLPPEKATMSQQIQPQYFSHSKAKDYKPGEYFERTYNNYSMSSIDNETLSEG